MTDVKKGWLSNALSFFKKHINAFYVIISVALVLLLMSLLNIGLEYEIHNAYSADKEISSLSYNGYSCTLDENGNITYTPLNKDPQIYLPEIKDKLNTIVIELAKPLKGDTVKAYFSLDDSPLSEKNTIKAVLSEDKKTAIISLDSAIYSTLRIDIDEEFTLDKISVQEKNLLAFTYSANLVSIIPLIIILGLLIGFEMKLGYFSKIKELVLCCVKSHISLFKEKKYAHLVIRALTCISLCVLSLSYLFIFMLARMSTGIMIYMFIISILSFALLLTERILSDKANACTLFLALALVFGIMMATLLPPMTSNSWDEEFHYAGCVHVRRALFNNEKTYADYYLERREFPLSPDNYLNDPLLSLGTILNYDTINVDAGGGLVNIYKYIGYVPGATAMFLGDLVNLNYFAIVSLAKIANVLVYAFVIYLGIKRLKSGAMLFSSVALLPTAMFIASSFSYDYFVTAFLMYSFAYFISELQQPEKKFTIKDGIFMLGSLIIGCGPKAIYFILGAPMLFMGKHKFESKKAYKYYIIACILAMLIVLSTFIIPFLLNVNGSSDNRGGEAVSSGSQVDFIFGNPVKYTQILLKFLGEYVSLSSGAVQSVNLAYLGAADSIFGSLAIFIMIFCAFTDKSEADSFPCSVRTRLIAILTCFAQLSLVATSLYVSFTPVGLETINGCQWRYIIPVLVPFLYFICSGKIKSNIDKRISCGFVYGGIALSLFATFYDLYLSRITF